MGICVYVWGRLGELFVNYNHNNNNSNEEGKRI